MIFFFHGSNTFASRRQVEQMIEQYVKKTGGDLGLERLDGTEVTLAQLVASLQSVPFLATSRLLIVDRLSQNKTVGGQVEKAIANVPASTVAVFYEGVVDKRTGYFKTLAAAAKTVAFEPLQGAAARQWVQAEAKRLGGSIGPAAVQVLLDRAGGEAWRQRQEADQWLLHHELQKLVTYQPEITEANIRELVEPAPAQSIFDLVEAMTAGRTEAAMRAYRELVGARVNELYILTMLIWQLRNLLLAKTAGQRGPGELAADAGMSPFVARRALADQRNFTEERLVEAFQRAVDTEYQIKTGAAQADMLVERLIYELAGR